LKYWRKNFGRSEKAGVQVRVAWVQIFLMMPFWPTPRKTKVTNMKAEEY
jgi:hypothetical protein